jgi:fumarylpyruvate hydrolase
MTNYVIEPAQQVSLPVRGSDAVFPVRRIYCIGRNYADHAIEMGHDPDKEPPFFFQKNAENVDTSGEFPYPPQTSDVHFEMEMIVALKSGGVDIREEDALDHVFGYGPWAGYDAPRFAGRGQKDGSSLGNRQGV